MTRPLSERMEDWRYWLEQVAHFLLGGAIAYAFASDLAWWMSTALSTSLGIVRELLQNLRRDGWHGSKADAAVDLAFWSLGATLGSLIA